MDLPIENSRLLKYAQSRGTASHPSEVEVTSMLSAYHQFSQPAFDCNEIQKELQGFYAAKTSKFGSHKLDLDQESASRLCATQRHMRAQPRINWTKSLPSLDHSSAPQYESPMETEQEEDQFRAAFPKTGLMIDPTELITTNPPLFPHNDIPPPECVQEMKAKYGDNFGPKKLNISIASLALMSKARRDVGLFEAEPPYGANPLETGVKSMFCQTLKMHKTTQVGAASVETSSEPVNTPDPSPEETLDKEQPNTVSKHFSPDSTKGNVGSAQAALDTDAMALGCEMPSLKDTVNDNQPHQSSASGLHQSSGNSGSFSMGLGSLSNFMATRGLNTSANSSSNPPFSSDISMDSGQKQSDSTPSETTNQTSDTSASYQFMRLDTPSLSIPYEGDVPLAIFLSADLLKTHLPLVQSLEQLDDPPKLLYREYTPQAKPIKTNIPAPRGSNSKLSGVPPEADLIIAPSVGIILATAQDLTQLYLPGHGPSDPEIRKNPDVTSPLRERILRLSPRYRTLHMLVSHPTSNFMANPNEPGSSDRQLRLDKFTHDSIASMNDFCRCFKTDVILVHTPAIPEKMTELIIVLATIASSELLPIHMPPTSSALDPSNIDDIYESVSVPSLLREDETRSELCLRSVGLNPYAARVVLDVLEAGGRVSVSCSLSRGAVDPEAACSMFLNMGYHERMSRFQLLLGEHLLLYVEEKLMEIYDEEDDFDFNSTYWAYSL
ncbi:hypothetical protein N7540_004894 [Penicillium herquei]|nr:hypothetical protein N7540_004894 [Penicillium herquei]